MPESTDHSRTCNERPHCCPSLFITTFSVLCFVFVFVLYFFCCCCSFSSFVVVFVVIVVVVVCWGVGGVGGSLVCDILLDSVNEPLTTKNHLYLFN